MQNARQERCKHHSDSGQQVSSILDNNLEVPADPLLKISVLSCSKYVWMDKPSSLVHTRFSCGNFVLPKFGQDVLHRNNQGL